MGNVAKTFWGVALICGAYACSSDDTTSTPQDDAQVSSDAATNDAAIASPDAATIEDAGVVPPDPPDAATDAHPRFAELADETAIDLGAFACTAPGDEEDGWCRAVTDYSGLVYDSVDHRLLMFGGGHATTMTDTIFAFDLDESLTWSELYEPTPCDQMVAGNLDAELGAWKAGSSGPYPRPLSIHSYDLNAFSPERDQFIMLSRSFTGGICNTVGNDVGGPIAHYGMSTGQWTFTEAAPSRTIAASELDPTTGLIVVLGSDGLKVYDPTAESYVAEFEALDDAQGGAFDVPNLGYANHMVYFPPTDAFYYFMRGQPVEVVALKLDRAAPERSTLELLATEGPSSPHDEPGYDYDAVNEIIGGGVHEGSFYAFDPRTATWTQHAIQGASPGTQAFHALGYDPISNVFVFRSDTSGDQHTYAFRLHGAR